MFDPFYLVAITLNLKSKCFLFVQFIIDTLEGYGWDVKLQDFDADTPIGKKKMTNIIATLNPNADRVLALAAHYDSKLLPPQNGKYFVAATDSAVPCAMLLDMARVLSEKANDSDSKVCISF